MFSKFPAGILQVTVVEARKLKSEDFMGKSDPYVELWIDDDYKQKTTVIENNSNPIWNETFTFHLSESRKHKLYLEVKDKDTIGSDDVGDATFDYEDVFTNGEIDTWVNLPAKLGLTSHGEVHLYLKFVPSQE